MFRKSFPVLLLLVLAVIPARDSYAFWVWTPKDKMMINPKFAVKDSPEEQFEAAMRFYKQNEFQRAADEFVRLTQYYGDSDLAPEAQYYAGRSYEELGKYYFAYENYQKTVENYPFTRRMTEIIEREYNIANTLQAKGEPKLMDLELSMSLDRAATIYRRIVENAPFGEYADKSLYKLAECCRRMQKYKEGIEAYEKIIKDYPESDLVPETKYQLAYTRYEASLDPEYDQGDTEEALREFQNISKTTSVPDIAKEADKMLDELRNRKADSILQIAKFYERVKKYPSALIYYRNVTGKFPGTEAAKYAAERIERLNKVIKK